MWVRQSEVPSSSSRLLGRTQYLDPIRARAHAAIVAYFFAQPQGEDVTLAVLLAIGEHRLRSLIILPINWAPDKAFLKKLCHLER